MQQLGKIVLAGLNPGLLLKRQSSLSNGHAGHQTDNSRRLRSADAARLQVVADGLAWDPNRLRHLSSPGSAEENLPDLSYVNRSECVRDSHMLQTYI